MRLSLVTHDSYITVMNKQNVSLCESYFQHFAQLDEITHRAGHYVGTPRTSLNQFIEPAFMREFDISDPLVFRNIVRIGVRTLDRRHRLAIFAMSGEYASMLTFMLEIEHVVLSGSMFFSIVEFDNVPMPLSTGREHGLVHLELVTRKLLSTMWRVSY